MKSFFLSLTTGRALRKFYRTRDEARADAYDNIEGFYNLKLRHSKLDYLSPMEFETRVQPAEPAVHQTASSSSSPPDASQKRSIS
jgi:putative transposase